LPTRSAENGLTERRYATVVLRLVLDRRSRLLYGEALEAESNVSQRFVAWSALAGAVRACLAGSSEQGSSDPKGRS
jgi:hypothetical protein